MIRTHHIILFLILYRIYIKIKNHFLVIINYAGIFTHLIQFIV